MQEGYCFSRSMLKHRLIKRYRIMDREIRYEMILRDLCSFPLRGRKNYGGRKTICTMFSLTTGKWRLPAARKRNIHIRKVLWRWHTHALDATVPIIIVWHNLNCFCSMQNSNVTFQSYLTILTNFISNTLLIYMLFRLVYVCY